MALHPENENQALPVFSQSESDALLGRIMTDLDLPQHSPGRRRFYHAATRALCLAPRLVWVAGALLVIWLLTLTVAGPPEIEHINVSPGGDGTSRRVSFEVDGPLMMDMWVRLNNEPLEIQHEDRTYYVDANHNGILVLEVETPIGSRTQQMVAIDGVDETAPNIVNDALDGDDILIYVDDADGVGIDWEGITGELASGAEYPCLGCDAEAGYVRFRFPPEVLYITVPDRNGNLLRATLTPNGTNG